MSRKILQYTFYCFLDRLPLVARQKIKVEATHEILRKPPSIFRFFQFHIGQYTTKITRPPNLQLDYHNTLPRINPFEIYEKQSHG